MNTKVRFGRKSTFRPELVNYLILTFVDIRIYKTSGRLIDNKTTYITENIKKNLTRKRNQNVIIREKSKCYHTCMKVTPRCHKFIENYQHLLSVKKEKMNIIAYFSFLFWFSGL